MNLHLDTPVQYVPRVGPAMAGKLEKLGIRTIRELLYHIPFRYDDFSRSAPIASLKPGMTATVSGSVRSMRLIFTKTGKRMQEGIVADATGQIPAVWFNQPYLAKIIKPGDTILLAGTIGFFGNRLVMESPVFELPKAEDDVSLHTGRFVPIYAETAGISSKWLRGRIAYLLTMRHLLFADPMPPATLSARRLPGLLEAISGVHFPDSLAQAEICRRRLAFDELFFLQLRANRRKKHWQETQHAPVLTLKDEDITRFTGHLPFTLTDDQQKAIRHIAADIDREIPMNRLLEGDVGSGKTVVAALALYAACRNGYSGVLMAPTQILAEQHYRTVKALFDALDIPVSLIVGGNRGAGTRKPLSDRPSALIGTHALLSEKESLKNVGVVIVDEQQRFGVHQRKLIHSKDAIGRTPHFLTMTATPIPRTLALTVYGNLDLSVLTQMPNGRQPVKTWVVPDTKRQDAYAWIRKQLRDTQGRVFIVCPFIDESDSAVSVKAAKKEYEHLSRDIFPDLSLGLLHGSMKPTEKEAQLTAFRSGEHRILVTTPVVEVGIDVREATIMVIEGADRFGLSQLHQLRGRVGRGDLTSYCLLFTDSSDPNTMTRLKTLETVRNGPELAEYDLMFRGEGDVLGIRQHGLPALALTSLRDRELLEQAKDALGHILKQDPDLIGFPLLREEAEKGTIEDGIQD